MSRQKNWSLLGLLMSLLFGQGLYWFIGGAAQSHSTARNVAVLAQIVVAVAILVWAESRRRRALSAEKRRSITR